MSVAGAWGQPPWGLSGGRCLCGGVPFNGNQGQSMNMTDRELAVAKAEIMGKRSAGILVQDPQQIKVTHQSRLTSKQTFTERTGRGTKEWSDHSYNICRGCEHGCLYCYAKALACRFEKSMRLPGNWDKQTLNPGKSRYGAEVGRKGVVMFPTSHDITPNFLAESLRTIENLLVNNQVLIVSKPHLKVVRSLCSALARRKEDVMFRFTIGSLDAGLCRFWEPGAPVPAERIECLEHAYREGFKTSVSVEPMLAGREETIKLVDRLAPAVTDTIWIGKMQRIPSKLNQHIDGFAGAVALVKAQQTDAQIVRLATSLNGNPKVRWKDSIKAVLEKSRTPAC